MNFKQLVLFICASLLESLVAEPLSECKSWAYYGKTTYITFIDNPCDVKWRSDTRYADLNKKYLTLPKGVPFSSFCGSCYGRNVEERFKLTAVDSEHVSIAHPVFYEKNSTEFSYKARFECATTYVLTQPLRKDGFIMCKLLRSYNPVSTTVIYNLVDAEFEDEQEMLTSKESSINLTCSDALRDVKHPTYVWYPTDTNDTNILVFSSQMQINLRLTSYRNSVTCAAYDFQTPNKVYRKTINITTTKPKQGSPAGVSVFSSFVGVDEKADSPGFYKSVALISFLAVVGGVLVILGLVITVRFVLRLRRPEANEHEVEMLAASSLDDQSRPRMPRIMPSLMNNLETVKSRE